MDISQAREIIEALANGIDPTTGEVFAKDHSFNDPDIIRALFVATEELKKAEKGAIINSPKTPVSLGMKNWITNLNPCFLQVKAKKKSVGILGEQAEQLLPG